MDLSKLTAPSLKELFIKEFESMILSGRLAVGEKLPPEREIAESMQVSRGVVNSGITELARKGFIIVKPRSGAYVADYRRTGTLETLISIINHNNGAMRSSEIRSILEITLTLSILTLKLLIPKLTENDITFLRSIVDEISAAQSDWDTCEKAYYFHHEMSVMSGNMLMPLLYYSFKDMILSLWERSCFLYGKEKLFINQDTLMKHIERRDVDAAVKWTETLLQEAVEGKEQIYY